MTIREQFQRMRSTDQIGLMTHIVAGYPDVKTSAGLVKMMAKWVDFVEIQIPFSDPLADGPVIMGANQQALDKGIKVRDSFKLMKQLSQSVKIPLLFMGYYNTVFNYGLEKFCRDAAAAGAQGLIFPDITLEEGEYYFAACKKNNLAPIFVVAPNTPEERLRQIKKYASGFVYCMARVGTTGNKTEISKTLGPYLKRVKKIIGLPVAVGFGIQNRQQVESLQGLADVAVVGSEVIRKINETKSRNSLKNVEQFLRKLI